MNQWDRDNLMFILGADEAEFEAWLSQTTREDVVYALELFAKHRNELAVVEMELNESNEKLDCTMALEVINHIRRKTK
jgi:hypothetical protein